MNRRTLFSALLALVAAPFVKVSAKENPVAVERDLSVKLNRIMGRWDADDLDHQARLALKGKALPWHDIETHDVGPLAADAQARYAEWQAAERTEMLAMKAKLDWFSQQGDQWER